MVFHNLVVCFFFLLNITVTFTKATISSDSRIIPASADVAMTQAATSPTFPAWMKEVLTVALSGLHERLLPVGLHLVYILLLCLN